MHHPTDSITHTTAFVTPVVEDWVEREIAQWVHPMKYRSDDNRTMSERSYHGATSRSSFHRLIKKERNVLFNDAHSTTFVTPVVEHWLEREIAQWVHPMKHRSDDPSHHERTLLLRSYISLPCH